MEPAMLQLALILVLGVSSVSADEPFCLRTALLPPNNVSPGPEVNIPSMGKVLGLDRKEFPSIAEFRGIPYAEAPTGPLRWQPPRMSRGWGHETFAATAYGSICMQPISPGGFECATDVVSEDCLHLHIATPKTALEVGAKKLPVMFFMHGGAYGIGAGQEVDTASLVDASGNQVLVVSINYRLSVFGYLGGDAVMSRTNGSGGGNFGIQDQRLALQWVKMNIGVFGGDASDVTIFGQSAGATSVLFHLVQSESFDLYHKAVSESGAHRIYQNGYPGIEESNENFEKLLRAIGCDDMQCLLNADAKTLTDALSSFPAGPFSFQPVLDGVSQTDDLGALFKSGQFNKKVPIILGSNRDEAAGDPGVKSSMMDIVTEEDFDKLEPYINMDTGKLDQLKRLYNASVYQYPKDLGGYSIWAWMHARVDTETMVNSQSTLYGYCTDRWLAQQLVREGSQDVRLYRFEKSPNGQDELFTVHSSEVGYVFNLLYPPIWKAMETGNFTWNDDISEDERGMGNLMSRYWTNFAISGDPSSTGDGLVDWPKFTSETESVLRIADASAGGITAHEHFLGEVCDWHLEHAQSLGMYYNGPDENRKYASRKIL